VSSNRRLSQTARRAERLDSLRVSIAFRALSRADSSSLHELLLRFGGRAGKDARDAIKAHPVCGIVQATADSHFLP